MASPAWLAGFMAAFVPSARYDQLFAMSDRELQKRGYDRNGLEKSFIAGLGR